MKIVCRRGSGALLTDEAVAAPAVVATAQGGGDATIDRRPGNAGVGEGARFEFRGGTWRYNRASRNFDASGPFEIAVNGTASDVLPWRAGQEGHHRR